MNDAIRHRYAPPAGFADLGLCNRCGWARSNIRHRLGSRCSMCFRYFRHYELDSSRRCDECRP